MSTTTTQYDIYNEKGLVFRVICRSHADLALNLLETLSPEQSWRVVPIEVERDRFSIYLNDQRLADTCIALKRDAIAWVKTHVLSTHMGEWRRLPDNLGYEYSTTIGKYYKFIREISSDENL